MIAFLDVPPPYADPFVMTPLLGLVTGLGCIALTLVIIVVFVLRSRSGGDS